MFTSTLKKAFYPQLARAFATHSRLVHSTGTSRNQHDTRNVTLRGTYIKGNFNDLPNLIFFPELCDPASNWTNFFLNPDNSILNYRNIWLLNYRNFGNSDRHPSFDLEEMSNDVVRFMYEHKISTATLAGHGFGGKLALAVGCYHGDRVTGVVGIDSAPLDQRYHEPFHELRTNLERLRNMDMTRPRGELEQILKVEVADPKWRSIFAQNIKKTGDRQYGWDFDLEALYHNVKFNKADSVGYWAEKHGLYTGRVRFIFPEYSRWVHLATNTLPMMKVCVRCHGYGRDIFAIQGDESPLNHWMYELDDLAFPLSRKMNQFIRLYDGVHVLLQDRTEIGNYFIPDRHGTRNNSNHVNGDYSPAHLHHNWRFSNIYEEARKFEEGSKKDEDK